MEVWILLPAPGIGEEKRRGRLVQVCSEGIKKNHTYGIVTSFAAREKHIRGYLQQKLKYLWIHADSNSKNPAASHQTPLFALLCWSGFTGGQHALCRLPSLDLYLKCINNLREVRRDTPDSPSRRNTTAHFFSCWWIYSSSLNLQSQIDQKRKPGGEMWKWDFF